MEQLKQKAIQQYLAKPESYSGACGCMGPQKIAGFKLEKEPYELELQETAQRSKFIIKVHKNFNVSLEKAKEMVDEKKVGFDNPYICKRFKDELQENGIETKLIKNPTGEYPECSCAMRNVEQVEGYFFRITQNRSPEGIKLEAILLGPIGGPYQNVDRYKID